MGAYVIANFTTLDQQKLKQYGAAAAETLANYGGEYIAKGNFVELHGKTDFKTTVIIAFPDSEAANNWYHSEPYQQLIELRSQAMQAQFQLVG